MLSSEALRNRQGATKKQSSLHGVAKKNVLII